MISAWEDPLHKALMDHMSYISEKCYHAGWLNNLEYVLWDLLDSETEGPVEWGVSSITKSDIATLRGLMEAAGHWIMWTDLRGEVAIPLSEWIQHVDGLKVRHAS